MSGRTRPCRRPAAAPRATAPEPPGRTPAAWRVARALVLAVLIACGAALAASGAEEPGPAVFVIDSSGSMAGREPGGAIKLDVARGRLEALLGALPAGRPFAVIAYGHRREADCGDIETLLPVGAHPAAAIADVLGALRARGKTPLSESLGRAAALLPPEGGGTIVLVSDGIETCAGDPCAVAAALRGTNARLQIHVVGFDLDGAAREHLRCIADAGGGTYWDAGDAEALAVAFTSLGSELGSGPADPPAPEVPALALALADLPVPAARPRKPVELPPTSPQPVLIRAVAGALGEIVAAPVAFEIRDATGRLHYSGAGRGVAIVLPPGAYEVTARIANARAGARFTVAAEPVSVDVPVAAGLLGLSLAPHAGAPRLGDADAIGLVWAIQPLDGQEGVAPPSGAQPSLLLAPGRYRVRADLAGSAADCTVTVTEGAATACALDLDLGTLVLEAVFAGSDSPIAAASRMRWQVGPGDAVGPIDGEARPRLTLQSGTYTIRLTLGSAVVAETALVEAGAERVHRLVVPAGTLSLTGALAPELPQFSDWRDASWTVAAVDVPGLAAGHLLTEAEAAATLDLPAAPGRWRVSLVSGLASGSAEVEVAPGETRGLRIDLDAGRLDIAGRPAAGAPVPRNIVFSVFPAEGPGADGEPVFQAGVPERMTLVLPRGRWRIHAKDELGREGDVVVDVAAGREIADAITLRPPGGP